LKTRIQRGDKVLVLDVRTHEERESGSIEPSIHIPIHEIEARLAELEPWRHSDIVVYCHHGVRSEMVRAFLLREGFDNPINLAGGIDAYATEAEPDLVRY